MDFDLRKRKGWPDDGGVSEVIGNILILMITVILFSGIIAFVQQIPVPEQTTKADFSAAISFSGNYRHANLTLVHAGGKVLPTQDIRILIEQDGTNYAFNLSDDLNFKAATWSTGKPWTIQLDDLRSTSVIIATVVDLKNSMMVWTSQVTGGAVGAPPNIQQRYVDSAPTTPTPDAVKENDTFTLFVKVDDPDGDLNSVWIDARGVNISGSNGAHRDGTPSSVGWYKWEFNKIVNGTAQSVDGNVIIIHAGDSAGHEAMSNFILDVTILPSDLIELTSPVYSDLGTSGLPAYLSFISAALGHGFGFYKELLDQDGNRRGKADTNNPSAYFTKDENVFIRFGSLTMSNVFNDNRLIITDTRTGLTFTPDYASATPNSTVSDPFYPYPTGGGAYVFECAFSTKNLPQSAYTITMYLKNLPGLGQTQQSFSADQLISVNQTGSPPLFMPEVRLYKNGTYEEAWGWSRDRAFDISSSASNTVYVTIHVQDTLAGTALVAEIRITDLSGGSELFGVPPAGSMISSIGVNDPGNYTMEIALRQNNGDMWLPGTNAYTLYISKLNDTNEGVYSLSKQLWIKGSQGKADFFAGTSGLASGNSNFNTREYQYFIQNNNFFSDRIMWQSESTPGSSTDYTVTALGVGDIDDDGDKDLLMAQASSNILYLFENTLNQFGNWQSAASISRPDGTTYPITSIAFGDFSGDGHPDFAYSNSNSKIVLYNVTYGSQGWNFRPLANITWSGTIAKIDLKDMTGDGRADLVILAGGRIWIYDIKYTVDLVLKQYEWKALYKASLAGQVGTKDFDIEDVDRDGDLDILTTGTSKVFDPSGAGVIANLNEPASYNYVLIDENAAGYTPRMEVIDGIVLGTHNNTVEDTQSVNSKGIKFEETTSGGASRVSGIMRFDPLSGTIADQILRVVAKVYPGPGTSESFFVLVSPDNSAYSYVGEVSSTSFQTYNFKLPSTVIGSSMYVKFTDSLASEDSVPEDVIEVDYCAVVTVVPGYTGYSIASATTWTSVRGAEINDPHESGGWLEVVVAKDGANGIRVFKHVTGWSDASWNPQTNSENTTFYDDCAGKVNDATKYPFSTLAPTLFDAVDINGDGFTDLLTCNYTTVGSQLVSKIGFFMNLYSGGPVWRYYQVKVWQMDQPTGQAKNPYIDVVVAASLSAF
jgi:hypothetical protein